MGLRVGSYTSVASYHSTSTNISAPLNHMSEAVTKNDFYAVGELFKAYIIDPIKSVWYGKTSESSKPIDKTEQFERKFDVYRTGLRECARNLESAVKDLDIIKIKQLVVKYNRYLQPFDDGELLNLQANVLRPLKMRIRRAVNPHFKKELQDLLPVLFPPKQKTNANSKLFSETTSFEQTKRSMQQSGGFPTNLTKFDGVVLNGQVPSGKFGKVAIGIGDVNGDGYDDIAIADSAGSFNGTLNTGAANIYFGGPNRPFGGLIPNVTIYGLAPGDLLGQSIGPAGDLNDDGIDDVVIGAPGVLNATGTANIFFGKKDWPLQMTPAILNGITGFIMQGLAPGDYLGWSACKIGDVNGDTLDDLAVGAYGSSPGGLTNAGATHQVFGKKGVWPSPITPAFLNGTTGFTINGNVATGGLGYSVCPAGDMNGDGLDDFVVSTPFIVGKVASAEGAAFVYFGKKGVWLSPMTPAILNGTNGFAALGSVPSGSTVGGQFGYSACTARDTNGDGFDDLVIGAPNQPPKPYPPTNSEGAFFLISGHAGDWAPVFNFTALNGKNGFVANAFSTLQFLGFSVRTAGDIDGDGLDDLIVGAPLGGLNGGGTEIVLLGQKNGWTPEVDLSLLNKTTGFRIDGLAVGDYLGASGGVAGNFFGNGYYSTVLLSAPGALSSNGTVYIAANVRSPGISPTPASTNTPTEIFGNHSNEGSHTRRSIAGVVMGVFITRVLSRVGG